MAEALKVEVARRGLGLTDRRDAWWVGPALTAGVLGFFVVYATFRALVNRDFHVGPYLSPFYSPNLEEWFGHDTRFAFSPAILILWIPGLFRVTCYYYRKAYYRAFFLDPPACAVGEARHAYHGETRFLLWQNAHRYALYLAVFINVWLWVDVVRAFFHGGRFGVGVGTAVLLANSALLTLYTLSCHSLRHLVGGCRDCFAATAAGNLQHRLWRASTL
ncbi:MAG: succinate dehydrogenase, partial [Candidatus Methylomirabilales bacterium]